MYFSFALAGHRGTCLRPLHIFALLCFALLCKVFEYCFLEKLQALLSTLVTTSLDLRKDLVAHCRTIIDHYVTNGNIVTCALDLFKAFDKVNHHALFIRLMKRHIPVKLLTNDCRKFIFMLLQVC